MTQRTFGKVPAECALPLYLFGKPLFICWDFIQKHLGELRFLSWNKDD